MPSFSLTKTLAALSCSLALVACGPPDEADRARTGPVVGPFVVSQVYTPSGLMGDGETPGLLSVDVNKNCRTPRPPGAQGDCYRFVHTPGEIMWAGAYWVYPSNNWGTVPGRDLIGPREFGVDPATGKTLRGYTKVRFWAAMDKLPDPVPPPVDPLPKVQFSFFAGGIDGTKAIPAQPYSDTGCSIFAGPPLIVTCDQPFNPITSDRFETEWKQYELDISTFAIESAIGGFGWAANDNEHKGQQLTVYFDDIVWE